MLKEWDKLAGVVGCLGVIAGAVTIVATKPWVAEKLNPVAAYVEGENISKITRYKCRNPEDMQFDSALNAAQSRHLELTGREYKMPPCEKL